MKQKLVEKKYFVPLERSGKIVEILTGRDLADIMTIVKVRYRDCKTEVAEFYEEREIFVRDVDEHLLMVRRRQPNLLYR